MFLYQEDSWLTILILLLGSLVLLRFISTKVLWLVRCIYVFFFSESLDFRSYGKWALVTGATDGIGRAYSEQLAQKGMNMILVSRSIEKLENLERELREKYKVDVKLILADFSGEDIYDDISLELEGLEVGVLVNNVGMAYTHFHPFHELSSQIADTMLQVNMLSLARMTHIVLTKMLDRKKGIIINIGSMLGEITVPLFAQYCASKAFVSYFTRSIQYEYKHESDIIIQYLAPGSVSTKISGRRAPSRMNPLPTLYVESALKTIGRFSQTQGYFPHKCLSLFVNLLPSFLIDYLTLRLVEKILLKNKNS